MTRGDRRPSRLGRRIGLAVAGVALGLALAEVGARLLLPPPHTHAAPLELDPVLGFRGIPGTRVALWDEAGTFEFALGREGLRGRELPDGPAAGRRLVFLGDSFLMGLGLREEALMTARTERALRASGSPAEVYNLSAIDYGTGQELLLFERWADRLAPDDVVLVYYPANDVVNDAPELAGRTAVSPGDALRPYVTPEGDALRISWAHPLRGPLRSRSRLFALLEPALFSLSLDTEPAFPSVAARLRAGRLQLEELEVFRRHDPGHPWERAWRRSLGLLRALRDRCRSRGARLLVLVVPARHQVARGAKVLAWDVASRFLAGTPLDALLDWNLPERRLARFFAREGIEGRLLLAPLREAVAAGRRVYLRDGHLAPEGHGLAARVVVAALAGPEGQAAVAPPDGAPVRVLPPAAAAPGVLDFRTARHERYLGDGWAAWQPATDGEAGGWQLSGRALFVLPERAGALFVEGSVPGGVPLPVTLRLERVGEDPKVFQLDASGPFRIDAKLAPGASVPSADGYSAFVLDPAPGRSLAASALRVSRLGIESAAVTREGR